MDLAVTDLGNDLYLLDAGMHHAPERLACYLFDTPNRVLIECGPTATIDHLYDGLGRLGIDDVAVMAVTHIHLDHAGGAGHFAGRFPGARIAVHERGARHVVSPERLWSSAERIYGPEGMRTMWGPMEPVAEDRLLVLEEGSTIPLGDGRSIDVMYTPGHAKHHVVFHEDRTGAVLVGDAVGLAFPHGHMVQPNTPPPDFDPRLVTRQLHRIAEREPEFLGFAHFGPDHDPQTSLHQAETRLWEWVRWVEAAAERGVADLVSGLREWVLESYRREGVPEEDIATYDTNTFWPMQVGGIERWLEQRSKE